MDKTDQLAAITNDITAKEKEAISHIHNGEYEQASVVLRELTLLAQKGKELKADILKEEIDKNDVSELRSIKPARKSVQNMLQNEVSKTSKFEKLLGEEMGAKSPYEMRNGNIGWREDGSRTAVVVNVQKREIPDRVAEMKKADDIQKGTFTNRDTGMEIQFSRFSIREILSKAMPDAKRGTDIEARMAALYQMRDLIENAVCFDSRISIPSSNSKSTNTLFMHRLYCVYKYDNDLYLANMAVEELYNKKPEKEVEKTAERLYSFRDVKITPVRLLGLNPDSSPQKADTDTSTDVTTITIPQLYDLVKTYDTFFYENPEAPGRADREAEIELHNDFAEAVKTLSDEMGGCMSEQHQVKGADFYETIKSMSEWADRVQEKAEKEKDKSKSSDDFSL